MSGRTRNRMLALAVCGVLGSALAHAGGVELKPTFKNGASYYLEVKEETKQTIKAEMMGPDPMVMNSASLYGVLEEVQAADGGGKLHMTFDRRMMDFSHPMMGEMSFDSDLGQKASDDNSMSLIAAPYVGKKLVATVNDKGEVTELSGWDELSEAIEDSAMGDQFYEQARNSISSDAIKNELIEWRYNMLPMKKVEVGETWTREIKDDNQMLGKVITSYECKLEKVEGKLAHITFSSTTKNQPGEQPPANPMGMRPELKNLGANGMAVIDTETGQIVKGQMNTSGNFEMGMPNVEDQKIQVSVNGKTSVRSMSNSDRASQKAEAAKKAAG